MRTIVYLLSLNIALSAAVGCTDDKNGNTPVSSGSGGQGGMSTGSGMGGSSVGTGTGGAGTAGAGAGGTSAGDAGALTMCSSALKDKYPWPAVDGTVSCLKTCGPDGIGTKACGKTPAATCASKSSSCAGTCPTGDCAYCAKCSFPAFTGMLQCYAPTAAAPPSCSAALVDSVTPCNAATDRLCTEPDATGTKTLGCVCCSGDGTWTCATWDSLLNTWGI
jgi:hypothetical protein